jgi:hypothetical protein
MFWDNKIIDQPKKEQFGQVQKWYKGTQAEYLLKEILQGLDCDKLPGGQGEFGRITTNPIPVNGIGGEIMYLPRLRCKCGCGIFFHRLGSYREEKIGTTIDVFETVCINGKHWDILYLDMYHPRRSTLVPKGYKPSQFDKVTCSLPISFGSHGMVRGFPENLPKVLSIVYADFPGEPFARKAQSIIDNHMYERPDIHESNLEKVQLDIEADDLLDEEQARLYKILRNIPDVSNEE